MVLHLIHVVAYLHIIQIAMWAGFIQFPSLSSSSSSSSLSTITPIELFYSSFTPPSSSTSSSPEYPPTVPSILQDESEVLRRHALMMWPGPLLPSIWIQSGNSTVVHDLLWKHWLTESARDVLWWHLLMNIYRPWITYTVILFYVYAPAFPFIGGWNNMPAEAICTKLATQQTTSEVFWMATSLTQDRCRLVIYRQWETSMISFLALGGLLLSFAIIFRLLKTIWICASLNSLLWPIKQLSKLVRYCFRH